MTAAAGLLGAARVRELLTRHGVSPNRSLGQNFVIDPNTIRKVVGVATPSPDERVLEVGPGAGSLTLGLAEAAASVIAVERDERLLPVLEEAVGKVANVEIVHADALTVDLGSWDATALVANLPYNIAASTVLKALQEAPALQALTVMTQREVGERLAASVGTTAYGAPSVLVAFFARARVAATVSRNAFWPIPNVDSVVVRIQRRDDAPTTDPSFFARVVKAAFSQRRKTLRNSLADLAGSPAGAESALRAVGIDPSTRAEAVTVEAYVELTGAFSRLLSR